MTLPERKPRVPVFDKSFTKDLGRLAKSKRKALDKVLGLIESACADHAAGEGKPEALSGNLAGFWSRRIDRKNRLVYRPTNGEMEFHQASGHYD